ncbi:MAG: RluA family pseudouridine synthase [Eubacterium sp.]|nr:RluA family pseudouridine synthase [Eubacterium sp.]
MKEYTIDSSGANQRLDRFLTKLMPLAGRSFLQKMLRKKRIKVNRSRAEAKTLLKEGDTLQIYFSEETINAFQKEKRRLEIPEAYAGLFAPPLYEDDHILVINKPAGLLCQPDHSGEQSLIDLALTYLSRENLSLSDTFSPAVANRLDRNTSGVTMIPKDYPTLRAVNAAIRERQTQKLYHCIVAGSLTSPGELTDFLTRDETQNRSEVAAQGKAARLSYRPLAHTSNFTLLEITLHTGRTHQIRAQMAAAGHPVVGDPKYGDPDINARFEADFGLKYQLLHGRTYRIDALNYSFTAPYPEIFEEIRKALFEGRRD